MNEALGWIGQIVEWLGRWIPRLLIVQADHAGVRWRHGHDATLIEPGLRFYWPLVTEVELTPTSRQTISTGTQTLTTVDGHVVTISLVLVYRVTNPVAALNRTYEYEDTLDDVARTTAIDVVTSSTYEYLQSEIAGEVEDRILRDARSLLRRYGITVESAGMADFAKARTFRIMGD